MVSSDALFDCYLNDEQPDADQHVLGYYDDFVGLQRIHPHLSGVALYTTFYPKCFFCWYYSRIFNLTMPKVNEVESHLHFLLQATTITTTVLSTKQPLSSYFCVLAFTTTKAI